MNYRYAAAIVLATFTVAQGMQQPKKVSYGTYQDEEITPFNLLELLEKEAPLDPQVRKSLEEFIETSGIAHILSGADHQELFFTGTEEERTKLADDIESELKDKKIPLIAAPNSFIINVDNKWLIKRSKVHLGRQNVCDTFATIGQPSFTQDPGEYLRLLSREEWSRFNAEPFNGRIYQNVSRAMVYLRAREGLLKLGISNIHIPETHLVHIPGRPYEVEDRNYVVVERHVGELTPLALFPAIAIDEEVHTSLVRLTAYTGWWTMGDAVSVDNLGRVYYHDHELPNRHSITDILHRDHVRFRNLVKYGWLQLEEQVINIYVKAINSCGLSYTVDGTKLLDNLHLLEEEIMDSLVRQASSQEEHTTNVTTQENVAHTPDLSGVELESQKLIKERNEL